MVRATKRRSSRSRAKSGRPKRKPARLAAHKADPLLRASLAVSLDGYIADPLGGVEWLNPFFSPEIDFAGFMATIGATVMGRKTFELALEIGMPPGSSDQMTIVLTHQRLARIPQGVQPFGGDIRELVASLRRELSGSGKDIWHMGGGQSIDAFRKAGLIDRFELSVMPVLLGEGIPLFPPHSRGLEGLKLVHSRALKNGIVEMHYEPARKRR